VTIRPIRELGDPVLRTPSDEVTAFDGWLAALVRDLEETVDNPGRAGVAAPQIGVNVRAFSYNIDGRIGHVVNPVLTEVSEEIQDGDEGCLSVPGIWAPTVRAMRAVVEGFDVDGKPIRVEGEVDHLDGKVFLDRLTGEARKSALRALRDR
jgi:peptide deformylase